MMSRPNPPAGWKATRLRFVARLNPSKSEVDLPEREEVSFLAMEAIGEDGSIRLDATRPISEVQSGYSYFRDGDVAVAKITPCFENGKGALMRGLVGGIGFGTTELIVVRPDPYCITPGFLSRLFQSPEFRALGEGSMYGAGGQKRVPDEFVRNFTFALPPISEQTAITTFLDRETGKIDALVEDQKRLIELLKEKRQAVISHAVTKGLDPNARMKPSGVEWLGDVPEHWEVTALKRFVTFLDGKRIPLSSEERSHRQGEFPYYGASGIIDHIDSYIFDEPLVLVGEDGANLLNRSTPIAFVASGQYWVNNHAHILRPHDGNVGFWSERIEAVDLVPYVTGSAQPKLTIDALANIYIAAPPSFAERKAIADRVQATKGSLDPLIHTAQSAIHLC